ncbi:MAG: lactate racemase domain-containing protein, partial [Clostridia bacterium]|nr:lactate racemase domain-containing protein [Clostridia bacterium]
MELSLGFSKSTLKVEIDENNIAGILRPNNVAVETTGVEEVKRALQHPIGVGRLKDIVRRGEKIAIITSDITRPMPSRLVLPEVIDELSQAGIPPEDITVVFALGSHRKHTEEEKKYLAGDAVHG